MAPHKAKSLAEESLQAITTVFASSGDKKPDFHTFKWSHAAGLGAVGEFLTNINGRSEKK
jgi:hypothetical protein